MKITTGILVQTLRVKILDSAYNYINRLKKDEMHPDDPMYAYVMKKKRVSTKQVWLYQPLHL